MRKEITFAILAGITFGLVIAFGIWRANSAITKAPNITTTTQSTPSNNIVNQTGLTLVSPTNLQVFGESSVTITGATSANALGVISTESNDYLFRADKDGAFAQEIDLESGINQVVISTFNSKSEKNSLRLTLILSEAFFADSTTESDTPASTDSGDILRQKVQEKLAQIASAPTALLGSITDKQESTLQINLFSFNGENQEGTIGQVSVTESTSFVTEAGKSIAFKDMAIGDFILAMGYTLNGKLVLDAKRVVLTPTPEITKLRAEVGTLAAIVNKQGVLTHGNQDFLISFGKTWEGPEIAEIEEGEEVLVVTDEVNGKNEVRLITKTSSL